MTKTVADELPSLMEDHARARAAVTDDMDHLDPARVNLSALTGWIKWYRANAEAPAADIPYDLPEAYWNLRLWEAWG